MSQPSCATQTLFFWNTHISGVAMFLCSTALFFINVALKSKASGGGRLNILL